MPKHSLSGTDNYEPDKFSQAGEGLLEPARPRCERAT